MDAVFRLTTEGNLVRNRNKHVKKMHTEKKHEFNNFEAKHL